MRTGIRTSAAMAAVLLLSSSASAQVARSVSLSPPNPPRWDVAGHVTWIGVDKSNVAEDWDNWYGAAAVDASIGYHWNRHLRIDFEAGTSSEGHVYGRAEPVSLPGVPVPVIPPRDYYFRTSTLNLAVAYQFFENVWVHPFVAAGVSVERETGRLEPPRFPYYPSYPPDPRAGPIVLPWTTQTTVSYRARPTIAAGFKWYVAERAFVRSDFRTSVSSDGVARIGWRGGIGVDF